MFAVPLCIAAALILFRWSFRSTTLEEAVADAERKVHSAGGVDVIRDEARKAFKKYGTNELGSPVFFTANRAAQFPALSSLGHINGIRPWPLRSLRIQVSTGRPHGYFILVLDPDSTNSLPSSSDWVVLSNSCIVVAK
jgi:hypothetical protein